MRFIPTNVHAILDYLIGIVLIAAPWIFDFADEGAAMWVPVALGVGLILYSLITDYEYSLVNALPIPTHLALDAIAGIFLAASPWIFGFSDTVWIPHVVVGVLEVGAAAMTHTVRTEPTPRVGEHRTA